MTVKARFFLLRIDIRVLEHLVPVLIRSKASWKVL